MQNQLLLVQDVDNLGRSGDIVTVKPGYARNFLIPQKKAIPADKFALRMQTRLMEERKKKAVEDRLEAEGFVSRMAAMVFAIEAKADQEGKLYGSVNASDIVGVLGNEGISVEKHQVVLPQPIKSVGIHTVHLKLKEGVTTSFSLTVNSDTPVSSEKTETE